MNENSQDFAVPLFWLTLIVLGQEIINLLVLALEFSSIDSILIFAAGYTLNYLWPLELFKSTNAMKIWQFPLLIHFNAKAIQSCIREQNK